MNPTYNFAILLAVTSGFSQNPKFESAADEVLYQIEQIKKREHNLKLSNGIACLTSIYPEKFDGTYLGIIYYPNSNELERWKDWVLENRTKISYSKVQKLETDETEILYEYEPEKFRSNSCNQ